MIGTGPAEEAVTAIPLSDSDIIVAVSLPSKRYCVRSESPVGRRLRRSDQVSSMLAASIALRFQAHDWAPAWPEGARYRAEQEVIASSYSFSSRPCPSISRTQGRSLPTSTVGPKKRAEGNAEERMRPNTRAIIAANPNRPPGTNAGAKFKSRRGVHLKGHETEHVTIEQPTRL